MTFAVHCNRIRAKTLKNTELRRKAKSLAGTGEESLSSMISRQNSSHMFPRSRSKQFIDRSLGFQEAWVNGPRVATSFTAPKILKGAARPQSGEQLTSKVHDEAARLSQRPGVLHEATQR